MLMEAYPPSTRVPAAAVWTAETIAAVVTPHDLTSVGMAAASIAGAVPALFAALAPFSPPR